MRLWSLHPKYLDTIGLVALWREGLLAKKVLRGKTRGYRHHPQLERFRSHRLPVASINTYLGCVWGEARDRGFRFDRRKLGRIRPVSRIPVSRDQLQFELAHLRKKLRLRNRRQLAAIAGVLRASPHPLFTTRPGPIEEWELTRTQK